MRENQNDNYNADLIIFHHKKDGFNSTVDSKQTGIKARVTSYDNDSTTVNGGVEILDSKGALRGTKTSINNGTDANAKLDDDHKRIWINGDKTLDNGAFLKGYAKVDLLERETSKPHAYDADDYTSLTEREIVEETIREVILRSFDQEVPHSVAVQVEQFKDRENGKTYIEATLNVEREAHKKIIIGKDGAGIKKIGKIAREKLNTILGRDIFLQLWVKVRPDWRHNDLWIQRLGYKK